MRFVIAVAWVGIACSNTDELTERVTKLEKEVAMVREERASRDLKITKLLAEVERLDGKLEELEKKGARPSYPSYTPPKRSQPDPAKVYSVAVGPSDPVDGPADALVTIVKAYEYACPYCERSRATLDTLKKRYGKDLRIVYKQFVVHPTTATAAGLAACAANKQKKFAAMSDLLWDEGFKERKFDPTDCWSSQAGCPVIDSFARRLGLDRKRLHDDMAGDCMTWLRDGERALKQVGVGATPNWFVNGRFMSGAQPVDAFLTLIDEELQKAQGRIRQGDSAAGYYEKHVVANGLTHLDP